MEQILGPEVAGHPVWNLRTKTPNSRAVDIPWHQGKHDPKKNPIKNNIKCFGFFIKQKLPPVM